MVSTGPTTRFRVMVVGKGMIGSAAVRQLSRQTDGVALIGPDEPPVRAARTKLILPPSWEPDKRVARSRWLA